MPPLNYDPNAPRKPRPIASSPFMTSNGAYPVPGLSAPPPPQTPGLGANMVPTPMGWLPIDQARHMLNNLAPSREAIADTLGVPMDGMAWAARSSAPRASRVATARPTRSLRPLANSPVLYRLCPAANVEARPRCPAQLEHIRRLLGQHIPPGGFL